MKGRQDNQGQRSARCWAEKILASLHSPKAQSLLSLSLSFFSIQASKLSVKYSCDNAGGSKRQAGKFIEHCDGYSEAVKEKSIDSEKNFSPLPATACRPHMQLRDRISPNVVRIYHQRLWWQGNNRLVLYDMHTHTQLLLACEILPLQSHKRRIWMPTCAAHTHAKWRPAFWYCVSKFMATCLRRQKLVPARWYWVIQRVVTHP